MARALVINLSDVAACPITSLAPEHYRAAKRAGVETGAIECACGHECAWFAMCDHPATSFMPHPGLGAVPICDRCRDRVTA